MPKVRGGLLLRSLPLLPLLRLRDCSQISDLSVCLFYSGHCYKGGTSAIERILKSVIGDLTNLLITAPASECRSCHSSCLAALPFAFSSQDAGTGKHESKHLSRKAQRYSPPLELQLLIL